MDVDGPNVETPEQRTLMQMEMQLVSREHNAYIHT
jgi:hypothetical protein